MCGVYGIASSSKLNEEYIELFSKLGSELSHRGPDGSAEILDEYYLIGFNRLAIVDIANGMQPFYSQDQSIMVTANGQIYNHLEIREELLLQGCVLRTNCDM